MELAKIKIDEMKSFDLAKLKETEVEIRRTLAKIRLEVFSEKKESSSTVKGLKRNLARVLTCKTELVKNR